MKKLSKKAWIWIGVGAAVLLLVILLISGYNGLVDAQEAVNSKYSTIETQLQRRADLIPNFVETVKEYQSFEKETYLAVTEARAAVNKADTPQEQAAANAQLDGAIDIFVNAVTENYPNLAAGEQFRALQDELAGSENRIAVARKDYNDTVESYNAAIRRFPKNLLAGLFGFDAAEYFEADADAHKVPEVNFGD
ncbi:MAG: LemA family protein [Ruminococcaceae bacterium]|nr:LemA family protein [Oscillospiraceae bacterium]